MNDELNRRAPAQPEPAAPTPDTNAACVMCGQLVEAAPTVVEPLKGWKLNHVQFVRGSGKAEIGYLDPEDDRFSPIVTVDTGLYYEPNQAHPLAVAILGALQDATPPRAALTDEQVEQIGKQFLDHGYAWEGLQPWVYSFARAIEAAHGIAADRGEKQ